MKRESRPFSQSQSISSRHTRVIWWRGVCLPIGIGCMSNLRTRLEMSCKDWRYLAQPTSFSKATMRLVLLPLLLVSVLLEVPSVDGQTEPFICHLCGDEDLVFLSPDVIVLQPFFPGEPTCQELFDFGLEGLVLPVFCSALTTFLFDACECGIPPTAMPTASSIPSQSPITSTPSRSPTTSTPSQSPSVSPIATESPSILPTGNPSVLPSKIPSTYPSASPSTYPSASPSASPLTISLSPSASSSPTSNSTCIEDPLQFCDPNDDTLQCCSGLRCTQIIAPRKSKPCQDPKQDLKLGSYGDGSRGFRGNNNRRLASRIKGASSTGSKSSSSQAGLHQHRETQGCGGPAQPGVFSCRPPARNNDIFARPQQLERVP